jgi:hypothetical protein
MTDKENKLLLNIYRFGRKRRIFEFLKGLILFICLAIILWLSVSLADILFYFSTITRWGLWFIHIFIIGFLIIKFVLKPLINISALKFHSDLTEVCSSINSIFPEIKNTLSNSYNLITKNQNRQISQELHSAAIQKYLERFERYNFSERLKLSEYIPSLNFVIPIIFSAVILLAFKGESILHSSLRLLNPTNEYIILPDFSFYVQPGNVKTIKGKSINFKVKYAGPALSNCNLIVIPENYKDYQQIDLKYIDGFYCTSMANIQKPFIYQIRGYPLEDKSLENKIASQQYRIDIITPPIINNIDISIRPPLYTGQDVKYLARNIGDIIGLPGSKINLKATVNKILQSAALIFPGNNSINCQIHGERISADFYITENSNYKIILQDTAGYTNQNPIEYTISILPDNPPFVDIIQPGEDIEIQLDATLAIQAEVIDDYGISNISLYYKYLRKSETTSDTNWHYINLPKKISQKRMTITHFWDFNKLPVAFDDGIAYYLQAEDNNNVYGPGIGRSKTFYIRFPSLEEMFDSFAENENKQIEKMEDIAIQSEEIKNELEKINRHLKQANELEWGKKQQLENTLDKQKQVQEKVKEIQKELEELINKMETNELISPELLDKYSQLQELFQEIATPELLQAIKNLQQSLDKLDSQQVQQALQNFKLNQEEFQQKIERTMELLKQVQLEQKIDRLVQQTKKLMEQQEKISKQLQDENLLNKKEEAEQLINQQKQQEKLLDNIKQNLDDLLNESRLSNFQETQEQLKLAQEMAETIQKQNQMQNLQQNVSQQNQQMASNISQNLQNQISQMQASISQAQSKMLNQNKNEIMEKMLSATQKLLQLSFDQEQILNDTQTTSPLNEEFADISIKQGRTQLNFQKLISDLIKLSKKTFFIQPDMSKSLGKSQISMAKSIEELSERNKSQAMQQQEQALEGLNESVMQMQQSISQMAQVQSATGFEQFMEQLQQMAGNQGQLNEQTLNLFQIQGNNGSTTIQQQREMQRLAGEQAALQQALEKMANEMGSRRDVMGRLGELSGKMDEVVQDLLKQNVNRETVNRQREILSRMLDAQKSVREREYSKKRKAETAKGYMAIDPGELKNLSDMQQKKLQDALKKSLNEGYQSDYQNLIELYFKQLIQKQNEKK